MKQTCVFTIHNLPSHTVFDRQRDLAVCLLVFRSLLYGPIKLPHDRQFVLVGALDQLDASEAAWSREQPHSAHTAALVLRGGLEKHNKLLITSLKLIESTEIEHIKKLTRWNSKRWKMYRNIATENCWNRRRRFHPNLDVWN